MIPPPKETTEISIVESKKIKMQMAKDIFIQAGNKGLNPDTNVTNLINDCCDMAKQIFNRFNK